MKKVQAKILNPPSILYQQDKTPDIDNGKWRMGNGLTLYKPSLLRNWAIVNIVKMSKEDEEYYINELKSGISYTFKRGGLQLSNPDYYSFPEMTIPEVFKKIRENLKTKPQLLMFIFEKSDERNEIKKVAEKDYGLVTQCLNFYKIAEQINNRKLNMYLSNLLL